MSTSDLCVFHVLCSFFHTSTYLSKSCVRLCPVSAYRDPKTCTSTSKLTHRRVSSHLTNMSITDMSDPSRRSPKRKRSVSFDARIPQYDGAEDGAALQYAYDEEMPSELQSPDPQEQEQDGVAPKKQKVERPTSLRYVPHMTLRGHKRGVAAVKFSPDGRWIASCCTCRLHVAWKRDTHADRLQFQPPTQQSRSGTPTPAPSHTPSKATWPASPPSPGAPTPKSSPQAPTTKSSVSGTSPPASP